MHTSTFCVLLSLAVAGCVSPAKRSTASLVQPWSEDLARQEPFAYPFVSSYANADQTLVFVASRHSPDSRSATFKTITQVLEKKKFDLIVIEGVQRSLGANPKSAIDFAVTDGAGGFFKGEERNFTIQRALARNIPVIGGEPDDMDIARGIEKLGYSRRDLLFTYLVRQMPQWKRKKQFDGTNLLALTESFMKNTAVKIALEETPTFTEFESWYAVNNLERFRIESIEGETAAPYANGKMLTQRLASAVEKIRDTFIVEAVKAELKKSPRILMVYGGSHWSTQSKVWEAYFGPPAVDKLFADE